VIQSENSLRNKQGYRADGRRYLELSRKCRGQRLVGSVEVIATVLFATSSGHNFRPNRQTLHTLLPLVNHGGRWVISPVLRVYDI